LLRIDQTTGCQVAREPFDGIIHLDGYGLAVATSVAGTDVD
jgi:hypothetical protein